MRSKPRLTLRRKPTRVLQLKEQLIRFMINTEARTAVELGAIGEESVVWRNMVVLLCEDRRYNSPQKMVWDTASIGFHGRVEANQGAAG